MAIMFMTAMMFAAFSVMTMTAMVMRFKLSGFFLACHMVVNDLARKMQILACQRVIQIDSNGLIIHCHNGGVEVVTF